MENIHGINRTPGNFLDGFVHCATSSDFSIISQRLITARRAQALTFMPAFFARFMRVSGILIVVEFFDLEAMISGSYKFLFGEQIEESPK
jgi:hypothetical protein